MMTRTTATRTFAVFAAAASAALIAAAVADGSQCCSQRTNGADEESSLTFSVYALDTCPVSGEKLGSMGDPVVREYEHDGADREVRFCCAGCIDRFEDNRDDYFEQIDETIIEQQDAHYALDECLVGGRPLDEVDEPVDMVHEGRLVRFCCDRCPPRFERDPARYLTKLDEAVIEQQREDYPLDTCVVAGMELGSMGEPDEVIVGGTLVRFCCAGCHDGFREDPAGRLETIRNAWAETHNGHE